ncbi:hypothetical protein Moror_1603 [Moniliophthora roreri MCA 2997]|uniref:CBF1-interacting co-repressor CIR N-terminal domain-containing protein n=2 Tax=Moniliophthora roreri TaxID=221103 RepID=V2XIQ2_MONRO|nr:hypothetical protein Moror_1603 [Moniliophthora roreri MCA 2997]KAI3611090.1 hypothetical protein WG66_013810 [Moniliophthora roreri]
MGKLNIAHHKSYHPYRRDNIERVRRDEEEARRKVEREDERVMVADAEARIELLRKRAEVEGKGNQVELPPQQPIQGSSLGSGKHINFFEDLEQSAIAAAASIRSKKPGAPDETEKGIPLAPSKKDLSPWYSSNGKSSRGKDGEEEDWDDEQRRKRERDTNRKSMHDPLTAIQHQLASSPPSSRGKSISKSKPQFRISDTDGPTVTSAQQARLARESSERERALALIRAKKREAMGSETPMSTRSDGASEYGDMYNRREVAAARESRERRWGGSGNRRW